MRIQAWEVQEPGRPMVRVERDIQARDGEAVIRVAGCGVCHTDLGFFYDGVPTRHGFPLTLGHEVSGVVEEAGEADGEWLGRQVIVPAVIPCGTCDACTSGRGSVCPSQVFPGSDVHGGFATHLVVPCRGLCPVPDARTGFTGPDLADLSVIADAVSTPYQAVLRARVKADDLAIFVGAGGIGGFGVQIAAALGATVIAIDVNNERLELMATHGADLTLNVTAHDFKSLRKAVRGFAGDRGIPSWRHKIFETSGTAAGQATAFGLLGPGANLSVVGYTADKVEMRLSNLMAFDATAQGNWGCLPEHYPAALDLVLTGKIALGPFVERRPLATINETFQEIHAGGAARRVVLVPEG